MPKKIELTNFQAELVNFIKENGGSITNTQAQSLPTTKPDSLEDLTIALSFNSYVGKKLAAKIAAAAFNAPQAPEAAPAAATATPAASNEAGSTNILNQLAQVMGQLIPQKSPADMSDMELLDKVAEEKDPASEAYAELSRRVGTAKFFFPTEGGGFDLTETKAAYKFVVGKGRSDIKTWGPGYKVLESLQEVFEEKNICHPISGLELPPNSPWLTLELTQLKYAAWIVVTRKVPNVIEKDLFGIAQSKGAGFNANLWHLFLSEQEANSADFKRAEDTISGKGGATRGGGGFRRSTGSNTY